MSSQSTQRKTVYTIMLSVCLFLGIVCACLLVALVLIGKNLASQSCLRRSCDNKTLANETDQVWSDLNDLNTDDSDNSSGLDEISVRINLDRNISDRNSKYLNTPSPDWRSGWRLPRDVQPKHYNLTLKPHLSDGLFNGLVNITIHLMEPRDHIIVHGFKLNITSVKLFAAENFEQIVVLNFHNDSMHELWVVDLENTLPTGNYFMVFEFSGSMHDKRVGFYSSTYLDELSNTRYIATSKLEPTYARQVFPCFDEPNFKAKYTVQIIKPNNTEYIALSNMDQDGAEIAQGDGKALVKFNTSVPMSTYVTCFIVCDFKYLETVVYVKHGNPVILRVYATPQQQNKTEYALEMAKNVTEYYVDYFGIEYPLPKLDMIAIPDFVSGAMEHWGLVTYRETALLYDENAASASNKQRVATVVAHELAHMWFGNLVTMDWWNDLWLNEGFATYMQFKSVNKIIPDWGMADQFLIEQLHPVLKFDSTLASHPIVQTVITPDQITEIFDSISYNKGASVLRMLENAVGEKRFQQAITNYLNKHKYGNAVTKNLLDELQEVVNQDENKFDVSAFVDTWTKYTGYPVVNVRKDGDDFVLTQKRFWANLENENKGNDYTWIIPITYITDATGYDAPKMTWFNKDDKEYKINVPNSKWIKVNDREIGYYRVNYTLDLWALLAQNIKSMNVADKTHLLEDSFSLARTGQLSYEIPLNLTQYLVEETNYVPWSVAASKLKSLKTLLSKDVIYSKLKKHVQNLLSKIYDNLSWDKDSDKHLDKLLRAKILDLACKFEHKDCLQTAEKMFYSWFNNSATLPLDVKVLVYQYGMMNVNDETWHQVFDRYVKEIDAQEKLNLLRGLASANNQHLLSRLITEAWNETVVRSQDYFTCLQFISQNPTGTQLVWDHVREHWPKLVERYTLNDRYLGKLIPSLTSSFTMEVQLNDMNAFFDKNPDAGAGANSRKEALENVANNIKWLKKYKSDVQHWLNHNVLCDQCH